VRDGLTARALERIAGGGGSRKRGRGRVARQVEVHTAAAEESLTRRRAGGTLAIHFHSEEELMRIYDLLMAAGGGR
jgi:hypothetical protein